MSRLTRPRLGVGLTSLSLSGLSLLLYQACAVPTNNAGHYELIGMHQSLSCSDCHAPEEAFRSDERNCTACHYDSMPTPHHPGECAECHSPNGWDQLQVSHSFFPLDSGHSDLNCNDCHAPATYYGLEVSCISCHEAVKPQVHSDRGCETCHSIVSWSAIDYTHSTVNMNGRHQPLSCSDCHVDYPVLTGLDAGCESCHLDRKPNGHFDGACADCHDPVSWNAATFNHSSYFPVPHRNASTCSQCHVSGAYTEFSCTTGCHAKSGTDREHWEKNVGNYSYDSAACLNCHPSGRS